MQKIDFKKDLKHLYKASAQKVEVVDVPAMSFLMIDGKGDPDSGGEFQAALEALYPVAYTLKFGVKKGVFDVDGGPVDYGVLPLEGLWWADDPSAFTEGRRADWQWTVMIMQPGFITADMVAEAMDQVKAKKDPTALSLLRFEEFAEGPAAQTLHVGPFSEEGPTIQRVHAAIEEGGKSLRGKHHEIYLSDFRRSAPEKLKTVIRQPIG